MTRWAQRRLAPDAEVYSDGLAAFRAVVALDHAHTVIATKDARARCEAAGAKWVNTVLGNMKRALDGTYHHIKFFKYSERYLAEAAWRFNRRFELVALVPKLLTAVARCPGWTEKRLRGVPSFVC